MAMRSFVPLDVTPIARKARNGMPFLILDRDGNPMIDPTSGLICQFDTWEEAEIYRKANKGLRVIEIPSPLR